MEKHRKGFIAVIDSYPLDIRKRARPNLSNLGVQIKPHIDSAFIEARKNENDSVWMVYNVLAGIDDLDARAIAFDTIILKNHARTKSLTLAQRATLLSNFKSESSLMANCMEGDNIGKGTAFKPSKVVVFGLYQFTGIRAFMFFRWFKKKLELNKNLGVHHIYDPFFQVEFLMDEIEGKAEDTSFKAIARNQVKWDVDQKVADLCYNFCYHFVRPSTEDSIRAAESKKRGKAAITIYNGILNG